MGLTQRHLLPYPEPGDRPDIPGDLYELAKRLDDVVTAVELRADQRVAELEASIGELRDLMGEAIAALARVE
jgi:hypothetical protein